MIRPMKKEIGDYQRVPIKTKSIFRIIDEENDGINYNYFKSSLSWNSEERAKKFARLVKTIGKLLCPSTEYVNLSQNKVKTSTFKKIKAWSTFSMSDKIPTATFAIEGILKSTEFCFQMILRYYYKEMVTKLFNRSRVLRTPFAGKYFEWSQNEINQRLGMSDYKIYENLITSEREFNPFYKRDFKMEIKQNNDSDGQDSEGNQSSSDDSSGTEDESEDQGNNEYKRTLKIKDEIKKEKVEAMSDESSESDSAEQSRNSGLTNKQEVIEEGYEDSVKISETVVRQTSDSANDWSDNNKENKINRTKTIKNIQKKIKEENKDSESEVNIQSIVQEENILKTSRKRTGNNLNVEDKQPAKKRKPQQTLLTQYFKANM